MKTQLPQRSFTLLAEGTPEMTVRRRCLSKSVVTATVCILLPLLRVANALQFPENGLPLSTDLPEFNLSIDMKLPRGYAKKEGRHVGNLRSNVDARLSAYVSSHFKNFLQNRWATSLSSVPDPIEVELEYVEDERRRYRHRRLQNGGFVKMQVNRGFFGQLLLWFSKDVDIPAAIEVDLLNLDILLDEAFNGDAALQFLQKIKDGDQELGQVGVMAFATQVRIVVEATFDIPFPTETTTTTDKPQSVFFEPQSATDEPEAAALATDLPILATMISSETEPTSIFVNGTADIPPFTLNLNVGIPVGYIESEEFNSHSNRKEQVDERLATYAASHLENWFLQGLQKKAQTSIPTDVLSLNVDLEVLGNARKRQMRRRLQIHDKPTLLRFLVARAFGGTVHVSVNTTSSAEADPNETLEAYLSELVDSKNDAFAGENYTAFRELVTAGEQSLSDGVGILVHITDMNLTDGVVLKEDVPQDSGPPPQQDVNGAGSGNGRPFASAVSPEVEETSTPSASTDGAARVGIILGALFLPFFSGMIVGTLTYIMFNKMRKKRNETEEEAILEEKQKEVDDKPREVAVADIPDVNDSW